MWFFNVWCQRSILPWSSDGMENRGHGSCHGAPAISPGRPSVGRAVGRGAAETQTCRVLSWRVSITMEAAFCVETLEDALARHGKPEVFNTDRGSQFTGSAFTAR